MSRIVMFFKFTNTKTCNNHKLLQPSPPLWLVISYDDFKNSLLFSYFLFQVL